MPKNNPKQGADWHGWRGVLDQLVQAIMEHEDDGCCHEVTQGMDGTDPLTQAKELLGYA